MKPLTLIATAALAAVLLAGAAPAATTADTAGAELLPGTLADEAPLLIHDERRRWRDKRYRDRGWDRYRFDYDRHERWRLDRHPRRPHWKGRHLPPHGRFLVITNYWDYHLPPPPRGHYYVRMDNDIFLVLEATRTIVDAFILLELLGR